MCIRDSYQGGTGFLTPLQRDEIFCYLKDKPYYSLEELQEYIALFYRLWIWYFCYPNYSRYLYQYFQQVGSSWQILRIPQPVKERYIKRRYNIVYQSKQSYYDILKDAGLSWHRTQAVNPALLRSSNIL